jgi:hypothetical protein
MLILMTFDIRQRRTYALRKGKRKFLENIGNLTRSFEMKQKDIKKTRNKILILK